MTDTINKLAECLQAYADAGFTVIPLSARGDKRPDGIRPIIAAPGKIPTDFHWKDKAYDPFPNPDDFKYNFGVALQNEDLVVDVDPRNFPIDSDSFADLLKLVPELRSIKTWTVKTGGGGLHIYFKKEPGFPIKGGLKEFPGIEFKTRGQQVVGGGSTHPDTGKPYVLLSSEGPAAAPASLLKLIERSHLDDKKEGSDGYLDDAQTVQRFSDYLLQAEPAIEGQAGDKRTFSVIAKGRDLGLSPRRVFELVSEIYNPRCTPPWDPADLSRKISNVYKYAANAVGCDNPHVIFKDVKGVPAERLAQDHTAEGKLSKTLRNTTNFFVVEGSPLLGLLAFNDFSQDIVFTRIPPWRTEKKTYLWNDEEAICCKKWMANHLAFEPKTQDLHDAAVAVSQENRFHPVKHYLEGLKWDGHQRIATWLVRYMGCEDNAYTRSIGMKMLIAAVQRIYEPGCPFHYIPVFEGKQGTGKSRSIRVLAAPWFSDQSLDVTNKDSIDSMRGQWIIEFSEMESHRRSEDQAMKAFLSRSTDRARLAYMRCARDYPRQCIFIGTVNPEQDDDIGYLKDQTGNRRYWPVRTGTIDLEALQQTRDQLWAEAVALYHQGVPIYLEDANIEQMAAKEQQSRLGRDAWHERVAGWLAADPIWKERDVVSSGDVFVECIGGRINCMGRREQVRIAGILARLAWDKGTFYQPHTKQVIRGYRRPMIE